MRSIFVRISKGSILQLPELLSLKAAYKIFDNRHPEAVFDREADHEKAIKIETECAVLLENNGILPLKTVDVVLG